MLQTSENLHRLAFRLGPSALCLAAIMGDSTCAMNQGGGSGGQARWAYGIFRTWTDVEWAQFVTHDISQSAGEGASSIGMAGTATDPGVAMSDGSTVNPFCIGLSSQVVDGNGSHSNTLGRLFLQLNGAAYINGDFTAGQPILIRKLVTKETSTWPAPCLVVTETFTAGGTNGSGQIHSQALWGGATGARFAFDYTMTRQAGACNSITIDFLNHAADGGATNSANHYKTVVRVQNTATGLGITRGFGWSSISSGGWGTRNHIDDYSTAALTWEIEQCGLNTIILQIGINVESGESSGNLPTATFRANLRELVAKIHAAFDAASGGAGVPGKLLVVLSPWSGGTGGYHQAMSREQQLIAREFKHTVFASMEALFQREYGTGWYGSNGSPHLADGVHQSTAGAQTMARMLRSESKRALGANENRHRRRRACVG